MASRKVPGRRRGINQPIRDVEARNALVIAHAGMVAIEARALKLRLPPYIEIEDLTSAGYLGLIDAAERFDDSSRPGMRFASYARFRVRGEMLDFCRGRDWMSRDSRAASRRLEAANRAAADRLGRPADDVDVAKELGVTIAKLRRLQETAMHGVEIAGSDMLDRAANPQTAEPSEERVAAAILALPDRLRTAITGLYRDDLLLAEVAATLGVGESRVCQMRREAIGLLRTALGIPD